MSKGRFRQRRWTSATAVEPIPRLRRVCHTPVLRSTSRSTLIFFRNGKFDRVASDSFRDCKRRTEKWWRRRKLSGNPEYTGEGTGDRIFQLTSRVNRPSTETTEFYAPTRDSRYHDRGDGERGAPRLRSADTPARGKPILIFRLSIRLNAVACS